MRGKGEYLPARHFLWWNDKWRGRKTGVHLFRELITIDGPLDEELFGSRFHVVARTQAFGQFTEGHVHLQDSVMSIHFNGLVVTGPTTVLSEKCYTSNIIG